MYACKIEETTNGCRRGTRGQTGKALEVVTERGFEGNVQVDEQKRAPQDGQDQAQRIAEAEAALTIS